MADIHINNTSGYSRDKFICDTKSESAWVGMGVNGRLDIQARFEHKVVAGTDLHILSSNLDVAIGGIDGDTRKGIDIDITKR